MNTARRAGGELVLREARSGRAGLAPGRLWRLFATALSIAFFGVFALLSAIFVFGLALRLVPDRALRGVLCRGWIRGFLRVYVATLQGLGLMRLRIEGREYLAGGGVLIVANHPTLIDALIILSLVGDLRCIAKAALARNAFTGPAIAAAGYPVNDSAGRMIESAARVLSGGAPLLVFPEATRTVPGQPVKVQRGAALIAVRAGAPVVPVTIHVSEPLLPKGQPWWKVPACRPLVRVRAHPPWPPEAAPAGSRGGSGAGPRQPGAHPVAAARRLTARLQAFYDGEHVASGVVAGADCSADRRVHRAGGSAPG